MQSAYYLHINQAVDHERAASQPNAALSQEEHSVIIIHQCYDVVIDYNIFLLPLGSPTANPASGILCRFFSENYRNHCCPFIIFFFYLYNRQLSEHFQVTFAFFLMKPSLEKKNKSATDQKIVIFSFKKKEKMNKQTKKNTPKQQLGLLLFVLSFRL